MIRKGTGWRFIPFRLDKCSIMSNEDWSRFTVRINIRARRTDLYDAWTTKAGMEYWFLRNCEFVDPKGYLLDDEETIRTGCQYTFQWHGYPDEVTEKGEILEANGQDLVVFRFGNAGICSVRILLAGDEQIVEMEQSDIPTDEASKFKFHVGCKTGWTFYLTNLKSLFEGGIDLRNRELNRQEMLNS